VDLAAGKFRVPTEKIDEIQRRARVLYKEAAKNRRWISKRILAQFVGKVMSWYLAFPLARNYLASFYQTINSRSGWDGCVKVKLDNHGMKLLKTFFQ
jgi:hypothetical protein